METLSTTYNYNVDLLKRMVNRAWRRSLICQIFLLAICIAIIIFAHHSYFLVGFACGIIYHTVIQLVALYKQHRKMTINSFKILTTTATLTEQGYFTNSQATYNWTDMKVIYRYPDSWQIILKYGVFLILPIEDIPPNMQVIILERAKDAGCKIK